MFGGEAGSSNAATQSGPNKANSEAAKKFLEKSENDGTTRKKKVREREIKVISSANLSLRGCVNLAPWREFHATST